MKRKKTEYAGYAGKSGKVNLYKVVAAFKKDGQDRVKLEGFGEAPISFWVDRSKLQPPPPPVRRPDEETQTCWECGCDFTYRECQYRGGTWSESYCGC